MNSLSSYNNGFEFDNDEDAMRDADPEERMPVYRRLESVTIIFRYRLIPLFRNRQAVRMRPWQQSLTPEKKQPVSSSLFNDPRIESPEFQEKAALN